MKLKLGHYSEITEGQLNADLSEVLNDLKIFEDELSLDKSDSISKLLFNHLLSKYQEEESAGGIDDHY